MKLCECGCGQPTKLSQTTSRKRGTVKGEPLRFLHGHNGRRPSIERFMDLFTEDPDTGCWVWVGCRLPTGYGRLHYGKRYESEYAHRFAYKAFIGEIPPGLHIDHLCENKPCVNPGHLEAVTQAENNRRAHKAKAERR